MERIILHADMDAFFASVEQTRHPEFRGRPLIVGGLSGRSVVSAASYEARKFGVKAGMPLGEARRRCPHAIFVPVNMPAYEEAARKALEIYLSFTPRVDPISIDEAALDITGSLRLFGPPLYIAHLLQQRITAELGLSVSVGLGPNRLIAKMAAEWHKPRGLMFIAPQQLPDILAPLPVEKLWGIGPVTAQRLQQKGVHTIGQLQMIPLAVLEKEFGVYGRYLYAAARGQDETPVPIYDGTRIWRQMSEELTLPRNTRDMRCLSRVLLELCDELAYRLRREGYLARTITLKIRLEDFTTFTRSTTRPDYTDSELDIFYEAWGLLQQTLCDPQAPWLQKRSVRLLGVAASNLLRAAGPLQLSLFDPHRKRRILFRVRDQLINRYGKGILLWASLLDDDASSPAPSGWNLFPCYRSLAPRLEDSPES